MGVMSHQIHSLGLGIGAWNLLAAVLLPTTNYDDYGKASVDAGS